MCGVPYDTPCVLVQPSFEAAAKPGGYEVVKETLVVKPAGAGPTAPVTPVKEVSAKAALLTGGSTLSRPHAA